MSPRKPAPKPKKSLRLVRAPLVIMYQEEETQAVTTQINAPSGFDHRTYGWLVCELVRHIAKAFGVPEAEAWAEVNRARLVPPDDP